MIVLVAADELGEVHVSTSNMAVVLDKFVDVITIYS